MKQFNFNNHYSPPPPPFFALHLRNWMELPMVDWPVHLMETILRTKNQLLIYSCLFQTCDLTSIITFLHFLMISATYFKTTCIISLICHFKTSSLILTNLRSNAATLMLAEYNLRHMPPYKCSKRVSYPSG